LGYHLRLHTRDERQHPHPAPARSLRPADGNTDRHYGNISLVREGDNWRLSSTYDMQPMLYMPIVGEVVAQALGMAGLVAASEVWDEARAWALGFWRGFGR